jgi:hypothetical protein
MLNADSLDRDTLQNTLTVLLKHESDVQKARRALLEGGGTRPHPTDRPRRPGRSWN